MPVGVLNAGSNLSANLSANVNKGPLHGQPSSLGVAESEEIRIVQNALITIRSYREHMRREKTANYANVRLEYTHVDISIDIDVLQYQVNRSLELGRVAHDQKRVEGVDERKRKRAPRVSA